MTDRSTVRPGIGIGDLKFGASIREAEAYFGTTSDHDESLVGGDTSIRLIWDDGLTCWFCSDDDYRLGSIQVEHSAVIMAGHKLIGRHRDDVVLTLSPFFGEPRMEDMSVIEVADYWLADYDAHSLNLWFENGHLASIQWGYLLDETGNIAIWPK